MALTEEDEDVHRRKLRILLSISEDIDNGSVYEGKLLLLEILENLLKREGLNSPESMKEAYCAVARECTVKYLVCAEGEKKKYIDAIERIWLRRIMGLFKSGSSLISVDLKDCGKELKAAIYDEKVCERLREDNTRNKALLALKRFTSEQLALMDKNSLDRTRVVSENLENGRNEKHGDDGDMILDGNKKLQEGEQLTDGKDNEVNDASEKHGDDGKENDEDADDEKGEREKERDSEDVEVWVKAREREMGHESRAYRTRSKDKARKRRHTGPAKISSAEELEALASLVQISTISTPEHNRVLEELRTSKLELVGALQSEKASTSQMNKENLNNETLDVRNEHGNAFMSASDGSLEPARNNAPKPSLMERNPTACTYEWDDSIDGSPVEISNVRDRPHLPSPRRVVVSSLKRHQPSQCAKRRRRIPWLPEETEALKEGVARYGRRWKQIKLAFPVILARRTEIDLKDKYRVEMAHEDAPNSVSEDV